MKKWKSNNKGVTLLEVIMAVVILAIIVIPVTRAIIMSAKFQYKARVRQKLTVVSESLMEDFKAYTLDEIYEKFMQPAGEGILTGCSIEQETAFEVKHERVSNEDVIELPLPGNGKLATLKENERYQFAVDRFRVDNSFYDARIYVTPVSGYRGVSLTQIQDYNAKNCATMEIQDTIGMAMQAIQENFEANYVDKFLEILNEKEKLLNQEEPLTKDDVDYSRLHLKQRIIGINLVQNGERYDVFYEVVYRYNVKDYPYNKKIDNHAEPGNALFEKAYFNFEPQSAGMGTYDYFEFTEVSHKTVYARKKADGLNRLFVYYYPLYSQPIGYSESDMDLIVINNDVQNDLDFYLLKQKEESLGGAVQTYEGSYCPTILRWGSTVHALNLYHNLDRNLAGGIGNEIYKSNVNGFSNGQGHGESISRAIKQEDNNLLYEVNIEILQNAEVLSRLSGTIRE